MKFLQGDLQLVTENNPNKQVNIRKRNKSD